MENYTQDSSNELQQKSQANSNLLGNKIFSQNEQDIPHQTVQGQHKHNNFAEMDQNCTRLELERQPALAEFNKNKIDSSEIQDSLYSHHKTEKISEMRSQEEEEKQIHEQRRQRIDRQFEESGVPQDKLNVFSQPHQDQQEERNLVHQGSQELSQQSQVTSSAGERKDIQEESNDVATFKPFDFDIKDYTKLEILGSGAHGCVIKVKEKMFHNDVVIKLYQKEDKKTFTDETSILSILQKANRYELPKSFDLNSQWDPLQKMHFETEKYYGLFIKAGIGSLLDFSNYLSETDEKVTEQELFILTWSLLGHIDFMHKMSLCHRDIKLENIVIDPETFLPELIDYSYASEISKAERNPGTPGYFMEDFNIKNQEIERRDQLISRDYFALGITILRVLFPSFKFLTQKDIKAKLEKLEKSKDIGKKILAKTLESCIFGNAEAKKNILKEHIKNYFETPYWREKNEIKKEKSKQIYENFNPTKLNEYARDMKSKYCQGFKNYMAEKWKKSKDNEESTIQEVTSSLTSQEMRENFKENDLVQVPEERLFYDEEQEIRNNLRKDPEKTMEKCYEIIYHLVMTDYQIVNPQLYSTVMAALFRNGFLDDAIALGEKAMSSQIFEEHDWIFLNNLAFLVTQRNLREYSTAIPQYEFYLPYLMLKYKAEIICDITRICKCAFDCDIKWCFWTLQETPYFLEKELALTYFEMDLRSQESYFWMNSCFLLACQFDPIIDEPTRAKIKEFVYGVNFSEKGEMLKLLKITDIESVLFTLMSFCEIFKDTTSSGLTLLKKLTQEVLSLKKDFAQLLPEDETEKVWSVLWSSVIVRVMIGFIILYNLKYDLKTKFNEYEWVHSDEGKKLATSLSDEEFHQHLENFRAEQTRKWSRQKFLNSILHFLREIYGDEIFGIRLDFKHPDKGNISDLSIFGQELKQILFPGSDRFRESYLLLLNFEQNSIKVRGIKLVFGLMESKNCMKEITEFFTNWKMKSLEDLDILRLELCKYKEGFSHIPIEEICRQFSVLRLEQLTITMKTEIPITDKDFQYISKFISTQYELIDLALEFNLCLITSEALDSLAEAIEKHEELEELTLVLKNCPKIEKKPFYIFLERIKKLPKLELVNLSFSACLDVASFQKPKALPFHLNVEVEIKEVPDEDLFEDGSCDSDENFSCVEHSNHEEDDKKDN